MTTLALLAPRYDAAARRMNAEAEVLLKYWCDRGADEQYGGFHGELDRAGRPTEPTDKGLIQQSRHLWTLSMWEQRRGGTGPHQALAHRTFRFLQDNFRDADGEYFFQVSRRGDVTNRKKQLYAQAFAIYGLSEYARAFESQEALESALSCFRSIDARAHDERYLGYDQTTDPGFLVQGAGKGTNTHIHILEALTPLLRLTGDVTVASRLAELATVVAEKIVQPRGYAHQAFLVDWQPFGPPAVSYGHDLETAWLVWDALAALAEQGSPHPQEAPLAGRMLEMANNSSAWGFDPALGGYFEEGPPGGAPDKLEKVWWVQAEALAGLWQLHERTADIVHFERLEATLQWIERFQKDAEFPGWYWGVFNDGSLGPHGDHKGELWKTGYHDIRALVYTSDWITARLHQHQAIGP